MTDEPTLHRRLKERKLAQWAVAYLAGAFVVVQGVEVMAEPWSITPALQRTVHIILLVGLFITVVLAWYHGEKGRQRVSGPELLLIALLLVIAGGVLSVLGPGGDAEPAIEAIAGPERDSRPVIAVLPLANLSGREEDVWFTDGMHGQILTQLHKIGSLGVISGTSVQEYRDTPKNLRTIGSELGARYIARGDVLRAGDQVRVNIQLIDAQTDTQLWADFYDRPLSVENLLSILTDIAQTVAVAVQATLTPEEERELQRLPTDNLEAYEYYLRGNERLGAYGPDDFLVAVEMYERAVEIDPDFAVAHAALSRALIRIHFFQGLAGTLPRARAALDEAKRLGPGLIDTRMAQGYYYYWGELQYDQALEQFRMVQNRQPNNVDALMAVGAILRRQGGWEEAVAHFESIVDLDPRSEVPVELLAETYERMRRYEDAERWQSRSIGLDPYEPLFYGGKAHIYLAWEGSLERARGVLEEASERIDPASVLLPHPILIRIFAEEYSAALDRIRLGAPGVDTVNYFLAKAQLNARRDQAESAYAYYDSARVMLEHRVQVQPAAYGRVADDLGLAYAGLGRREEAISAAERALESFPLSEDAWRGPIVVENLAEIYALVGEHDAAIDQLESLPMTSSPLTASLLRIDPLWDPLRDHPRFQALWEKYASGLQR